MPFHTNCIMLALVCSIPAIAESTSDSAASWTVRTITQSNLSASQQQVDDWREGEKSLLDVKSGVKLRTSAETSWCTIVSSLKASLGVTRDNSLDSIRVWYKATDNDLAGDVRISIPMGFAVDPFVCASFKTQITESQRLVGSSIHRTAKLWDPVISDQSMGFTYRYSASGGFMSFRSGLNLQQIRASESTVLTDDPRTPLVKELYKASAGMECACDTQYALDSLVSYTGKWLARKNIITAEAWQVALENELRIKVLSYFGIIITANLRYDETVSKRVQFKQTTMFGLMMDLK